MLPSGGSTKVILQWDSTFELRPPSNSGHQSQSHLMQLHTIEPQKSGHYLAVSWVVLIVRFHCTYLIHHSLLSCLSKWLTNQKEEKAGLIQALTCRAAKPCSRTSSTLRKETANASPKWCFCVHMKLNNRATSEFRLNILQSHEWIKLTGSTVPIMSILLFSPYNLEPYILGSRNQQDQLSSSLMLLCSTTHQYLGVICSGIFWLSVVLHSS